MQRRHVPSHLRAAGLWPGGGIDVLVIGGGVDLLVVGGGVDVLVVGRGFFLVVPLVVCVRWVRVEVRVEVLPLPPRLGGRRSPAAKTALPEPKASAPTCQSVFRSIARLLPSSRQVMAAGPRLEPSRHAR